MKALQALLERLSADGLEKHLSRDVLELVAETSNGDIRSTLMTLQFACIAPLRLKSGKSKTKASRSSAGNGSLALVLFHLMAKLLYNKRVSSYAVLSIRVEIIQVNMILRLTVYRRGGLRRSVS